MYNAWMERATPDVQPDDRTTSAQMHISRQQCRESPRLPRPQLLAEARRRTVNLDEGDGRGRLVGEEGGASIVRLKIEEI